MARKRRQTQDPSSDDDAPEVVSHSTSKADAKRQQKALHDFEIEEQARRKARNRERDQKLKERARVTKGEKTRESSKGVRFVDQGPDDEDEESKSEDEGDNGDDIEARMLRAMRDAEDEVESDEDEGDDEDDEEFERFGQDLDVTSGSDVSFEEDEDDDNAGMSSGEDASMDQEASGDDEMDEDDENTPLQSHIQHPGGKSNYLADDLFAAAFASQASKPSPKKNAKSDQQPVKKRRRKSTARPKDLVIGGRTIRTLPRLSDPRSQATARSIPSVRARKFVDKNLAMKGKQAMLKAKKKGWERRPANVGVMKRQGAPHGFVRSTR